jgi:hypothetical protein
MLQQYFMRFFTLQAYLWASAARRTARFRLIPLGKQPDSAGSGVLPEALGLEPAAPGAWTRRDAARPWPARGG